MIGNFADLLTLHTILFYLVHDFYVLRYQIFACTMKRSKPPTDVSSELEKLEHNVKQNKQLPKLPANTTITKRPVNHAPIASPFAGSRVPKVVYVSRKTPVISAVKRVKKFLQEIEKRAMQSEDVGLALDKAGTRASRGQEIDLQRRLEDVSEKLRRDAEEVLVKASGRAMEQALRVAEWFRNREKEILTNVEVRTGSVSVVDDIVEKAVDGDDDLQAEVEDEDKENTEDSTVLEREDTTMELLGHLDAATRASKQAEHVDTSTVSDDNMGDVDDPSNQGLKKRRRKRKRKEYDADDIPEARLRWIKTIEVAISVRA